jgi:hypothetical protein
VNQNFDEILVEAIREGITEIVGANSFAALSFYLDPSIAKTSILEYSRALRRIFGEGAPTLERRCTERLYLRLNLKLEVKPGLSIVEYVEEARQQIRKQNDTG